MYGDAWIQLLDDQGAHDTRSFLEKYMINLRHETEEFWEVRPAVKLHVSADGVPA